MTNYNPQPGSIISGTHRPQDLISRFLFEIKDTPEYAQLVAQPSNSPPSYAWEDEDDDWWASDECQFFLESLFEILDSYAPDDHYFGAHCGDGSDFGFWPTDDLP